MYIIVGGSKFLGHYFIKNILEKTNDEIISTYSHSEPLYKHERLTWVKCDNRNDNDIDFINKNYSVKNPKIVYLAACSSPDFCEKNPREAWDVNVTGLSNFINKIENVKCLYFASTDVVYGGGLPENRFNENSSYNPTNDYGTQKMLGEQLVLAKGFNVFRLPLMTNKSLVIGKKHFFDIICDTLSSGKEIEMFTDFYRSVLSFNQCANFVVSLIEKYGNCEEQVINIASDEPISKYEMALKIANKNGYDKTLIKPVTMAESGILSAKRAACTAMDNSKLKRLLDIEKIELEF